MIFCPYCGQSFTGLHQNWLLLAHLDAVTGCCPKRAGEDEKP